MATTSASSGRAGFSAVNSNNIDNNDDHTNSSHSNNATTTTTTTNNNNDTNNYNNNDNNTFVPMPMPGAVRRTGLHRERAQNDLASAELCTASCGKGIHGYAQSPY